MRGTVKWFDDVKGYGFLTGEDGKDAFIHRNELAGETILADGQAVEFEAHSGPKGLRAVNVRVLGLLLLALMVCLGTIGCAADRATLDHRAAVMNGIANQINTAGVPADPQDQLDFAWAIENERRAAVNLSDAGHWREPTYPYPAKRPTELPWKPEDDVPVPHP